MQRRDSLGLTTKIPWLSKGSTQKFKTRFSQSLFSSVSEVFADNGATEGQAAISVSGMKLRSKKNLDGNQGRSIEVGPASEALMEPFDEGEQTLIRPDFEPGEDLEREEVKTTFEASERSEVEPREEVLFRGMFKSQTRSNKKEKNKQSSLVNQRKNAMMSSISQSEEQTGSEEKLEVFVRLAHGVTTN